MNDPTEAGPMPSNRDRTLAERQRRCKQGLQSRGGRRIYLDLPPGAVRALDALRARYSLPQNRIVAVALERLAGAVPATVADGGEEE